MALSCLKLSQSKVRTELNIANKNINVKKLNLEKITPLLEETQLKLALETDLDIMALVDLLNEINHPNILLNYDVGNSTSLGYDIKAEWNALSKYFISVHVKDRKIGGSTVPLGTGDVDFKVFFDMLKKSDYSRDLIIQGAREDLDSKKTSHIETCQKYLEFVKQYLD